MKIKILIIILLLACITNLCYAENGITNNQITLGMSNALSGPASQLGIELRRGSKVYFDKLNREGGIEGRKVKLISLEKWKDLAEVMDSELIKEPTKQATIDHWSELDAVMGSMHLNEPLEYFKENIDYVVTLEWYLSIDLQVLLWIRDYLEELDKSQDFKEIFSRRERVSPLEFLPSETRKQGFQMSKPQAIPALYQALTDNNLIDKISFPDFNDAFTSEKGCITWARNKDQLGYLIKGLQSKSVIISNNHMEAATRVFKVTQGKELNAGGLSSSADQLSEKKRPQMDGIIQQVIDS